MPLSPPFPGRQPIHRREITLQGYERTDGLFDIEATLADTKTHEFSVDERAIRPGERLHGMLMRMTVDETMLIVACEAETQFAPYSICPQGAVNFSRLAGLRIGRGFLRAAAERVGGTHGCTHLRELLQQMATVSLQTVQPLLARRRRESGADGPPAGIAVLNTCTAYATDGPVVKRRFPEAYTGP